MKLISYFYGTALSAFFSTSAFADERSLPEFKEMEDQQFTRCHGRNKQLVESFYLSFISQEVSLDEVFNVATGKRLAEKTSSPKTTPLQSPHFDFTGILETVRIPLAMAAFLHEGDTPDALEIAKQVEEKHEKYKGPQSKRLDALKKAQLNIEIENEWEQILRRCKVQKTEKYRLQAQNLTDVFQKDSSVYDVVLKRENGPRSSITPSFYAGAQDPLPVKKRKWVIRSQEWNEKRRIQN